MSSFYKFTLLLLCFIWTIWNDTSGWHSIFTGTGSRTNAIKDARISKSTFYLNKAITELRIVKPEVFQQEVHSAITNNLQLSKFGLRCKEVLVSNKDELKALKKAKKIF